MFVFGHVIPLLVEFINQTKLSSGHENYHICCFIPVNNIHLSESGTKCRYTKHYWRWTLRYELHYISQVKCFIICCVYQSTSRSTFIMPNVYYNVFYNVIFKDNRCRYWLLAANRVVCILKHCSHMRPWCFQIPVLITRMLFYHKETIRGRRTP